MEAKTLVDSIVSADESARLSAVGDALFQVESYLRVLSTCMQGLSARLVQDEAAFRDIYAQQRFCDDLSHWVVAQYRPIYERLGQTVGSTQEPAADIPPVSERALH